MASSFSIAAEYGIQPDAPTEVENSLCNFVAQKFKEAYDHRQSSGLDATLLRNLRARKCAYQPEEIAALGPGNDVYIGIAALKAVAAKSWIEDIILNNIDKPWVLQVGAKPDLPDALKERVVDRLMQEIQQFTSIEQVKDRAQQLKVAEAEYAKVESTKAAKRMESLIEDQMQEGGWGEAFSEFIEELCTYPTAYLRGPYVMNKKLGVWEGDKFKVKSVAVPCVRVIPAFDAFPAPNTVTVNKSDYFIERARFTYATLYDAVGVEGFMESNLRKALELYEKGYEEQIFADAERDRLENKNEGILNATTIDTIIYNGRVPGKFLVDNGVLVEDPQKHYEAEVWKIGKYVVRAVLNPSPEGRRPVYGTSYRKIPGTIVGQSVIDITYDVNRICNAAVRSLVRNMGWASGPSGEVVADRVDPSDDITNLVPGKLFRVEPDLSGSGQPAIRFYNVETKAAELTGVFEKFLKQADDLSGIPSYVLGNPQVAGAGRTMGGLSMLMGNAAKGIKNVQLSIDRDVIAPAVEGFVLYNNLTSDDESIRGDARVVPRGATGLLQRELSQTRVIEILQLLTPYVTAGVIPPDGLQVLLREVLSYTGLPVDKIIPNPERQGEVEDLLRLVGGNPSPGGAGSVEQSMNRGTSTPVPLPTQSQPPVPTPAIGG